jgi:hypothetical protein
MALGNGAATVGALAGAFLTGVGGAGGGGGGASFGFGGSISWESTETGTTNSTARTSRPLYIAQMNPTCSSTTDRTIARFRLMVGMFAPELFPARRGGGKARVTIL